MFDPPQYAKSLLMTLSSEALPPLIKNVPSLKCICYEHHSSVLFPYEIEICLFMI